MGFRACAGNGYGMDTEAAGIGGRLPRFYPVAASARATSAAPASPSEA